MRYNVSDLNTTLVEIKKHIASHHMRLAIVSLRHMASWLGDWHVTENIDQIESDYKLMVGYAVTGANDPDRKQNYKNFENRILSLADRISYRLQRTEAPELYYATLRFEAMQKDETLQSLIDRYKKTIAELSFSGIMSYDSEATIKFRSLQQESTELERRIFNRIWVMFALSKDAKSLISSVFASDSTYPDYFRQTIVSALLLGLIQFYDEAKLILLLDLYQREQQSSLGVKALCAALIAMYIHRNRIYTGNIVNRINILRETTTWTTDVRTVFMQFLKSRDTERINREFNNNVLPELMKLKPEMTKRLNSMNIELGNLEDNPEWEELLEQSGIADKLKKMQDMLEEGGDIFMSAFSSLKSAPFFSEPINWFVPYRAAHPALADKEESLAAICRMLEGSPVLCDSDKYSVAFALDTIPPQQRDMMRSQIDSATLASMEMQSSQVASAPKSTVQIANNYISSVYRFFKLFRRRNDFYDPFNEPLDLLSLPILSPDFDDIEMLRTTAEFYFRRGYYRNAYDVYNSINLKIKTPDCPTYQKMGYCMQKLSLPVEAIEWYRKAEVLDNSNIWTLRRMAACYSAIGHTSQALDCLNRIAELRPDDLNVSLNIGHCYLELGQYSDALRNYFKVEYLDTTTDRALRPIAWCSFLTGNLEQSLRYYERIINNNPNATDYMNMGHVRLANAQTPEAMQLYFKSIQANGGDIEQFIKDFEIDIPTLLKAGVDTELPTLIIDSIIYRNENQKK